MCCQGHRATVQRIDADAWLTSCQGQGCLKLLIVPLAMRVCSPCYIIPRFYPTLSLIPIQSSTASYTSRAARARCAMGAGLSRTGGGRPGRSSERRLYAWITADEGQLSARHGAEGLPRRGGGAWSMACLEHSPGTGPARQMRRGEEVTHLLGSH